ncbi:hypothetical protein PIB30_017373 [Stylosanthes scabra]|uniref:Uncharacterized protein n=1 Tax=Stylosanthes scabra TaxID=79078 RepID=A0ABU6U6E7_9FABA|nr:hypothetical protein [Stylosanthes scabra]
MEIPSLAHDSNLNLERHLDSTQTPSKTETPSAVATTHPAKSVSDALPTESAAYKEWRQNDLALQTWLAASISKPYQNKILDCRSFHEAWTTIQLYVEATSRSRIQSLKSQMRGVKKTVPEAEAFVIAFDEMLHRTKNPGQSLPVANLTQHDYY